MKTARTELSSARPSDVGAHVRASQGELSFCGGEGIAEARQKATRDRTTDVDWIAHAECGKRQAPSPKQPSETAFPFVALFSAV